MSFQKIIALKIPLGGAGVIGSSRTSSYIPAPMKIAMKKTVIRMIITIIIATTRTIILQL
jgi:hypothetical protein